MKKRIIIIYFVLLFKCFFLIGMVYAENETHFDSLQFQNKIKKALLNDKILSYQRDYQRLLQNNVHNVYLTKVHNRQIIVKLREGKIFDANKYNCTKEKYSNSFKSNNYIIVKVP